MPKYLINLIVAVDVNHGIAQTQKESNSSNIPWNIKQDLNHFRNLTMNTEIPTNINVVIMGRKTYENIPSKHRPLTGRLNMVISKSLTNFSETHSAEELPNLKFFDNIETCFQYINDIKHIENVFIIGGCSLYNQFLENKNYDYLYLTQIDHDYNTDLTINLKMDQLETIWETKTECLDTNLNKNMILTFGKYRPKLSDETQYLKILNDIIKNGHHRKTRNGETMSLFGVNMEFNLSNNKFPLLTTKKMFMRGIFEELKFFLNGQTNTKILEDKNVFIWKDNTSRQFLDSVGLNHLVEHDMGPMYGFQLRHFGAKYDNMYTDYSNTGIDQLNNVIHLLKTDRFSRRILMTTYNPSQVNQGPLPPCHGIVIQFGVEGNNKLSCHMYQRSADWFLGVPFNIASYALLTHIICHLVNNSEDFKDEPLEPSKLVISFGDVHIYCEHLDVVKIQLSRKAFLSPTINFKKQIHNLEDLKTINFEDIEIVNYQCHPILKTKMIA